MAVVIRCSNVECRKSLRLPDRLSQKPSSCPACGQPIDAAASLAESGASVDAPLKADSSRDGGKSATHKSQVADDTQRPRPGNGVKLPGQIGRFVIQSRLGAGAFGTVYRAYDPHLEREVALKVPNPGVLDSPKRVARFLREAKSAANLRHPHIVPVYDAGRDNEQYYIATAFIAGQPLADRIEDQGNEFRQAAIWTRELAEALAYAHEQRIVHRDVKPANCMVDEEGHLHLMDFGLAFRQEEESRLTNDGTVLGTPAYMAPEQAAGREAGPAADQYSVGVILYELLTGRTPFAGPVSVVIHNQIHMDPEPPHRQRPDVSKDLETICLKALSKESGQRYVSCQALADDLRRWLEGEPILARRVGPVERLVTWTRRNPITAGLVATLAVVLVAGTTISTALAVEANRRAAAETRALKRATEATDEAIAQARIADDERSRAEDELERAERLFYASKINSAESALNRLDSTGAINHLNGSPKHRRGWEFRHLWNRADQSRQTLTGHLGGLDTVCITPDGTRIVSAGVENTVRIWDAKTGRECLILKGHRGSVSCVRVTPDSQRIVSGSKDGTVKIWDIETGEELHTFTNQAGAVHCVCISPDGRWIVGGGGGGTLNIWDTETKQGLRTLSGHTGQVLSVSISSDGRRIVSGGDDTLIKVWDATTGQELLTAKGHSESICFTPDGLRIVNALGDTVTVWGGNNGEELLALKGHTGSVLSVCVTPDGRQIVSGGRDRTVKVWDAVNGQELRTLSGHTDWVKSVGVSPDGRRLVSGSRDGTVKVWDAQNGQESGMLSWRPGRGHSNCVTSTARRIVSGDADGNIYILDAETGQEVRTLTGHTSHVACLSVTSDGRRIVSGGFDASIKVWDSVSGQELWSKPSGHPGGIRSVCFSHDGYRTVGSHITSLKVWKTETGEELCSPAGHDSTVTSVGFAPNGKWFVSGCNSGTLKAWDTETGQELRTLNGHSSYVLSLVVTPDGRRIISGGDDSMIKIWNAETGEELRTISGHTGPIGSLAVTPDGQRIVSGGEDKTMKVWDVETGQELLALSGHIGAVKSVNVTPDGRRIISSDGTIRIWEAGREPAISRFRLGSFTPASISLAENDRQVLLWNRVGDVLACDLDTYRGTSVSEPPTQSRDTSVTSEVRKQQIFVRHGEIWIVDLEANAWPLPDRDDRLEYHLDRAGEEERQGQHFAAAFHFGRLLLDGPDNREWQQRRDAALAKVGGSPR